MIRYNAEIESRSFKTEEITSLGTRALRQFDMSSRIADDKNLDPFFFPFTSFLRRFQRALIGKESENVYGGK